MEEILNINGRSFMIEGPITPEIRAHVISMIQNNNSGCLSCGGQSRQPMLRTLAPTCTVTAKSGGSTIDLKAAPMGGTEDYTVKYYKKLSAQAAVQIGTTQTGIKEATTPTDYKALYTYPITDADIVAAGAGDPAAVPLLAAGKIRFSVTITDSCPTGAKTSTEICDVSTTCGTPTANFTTV